MGAEEVGDKNAHFNHVLYCRQVVRVRVACPQNDVEIHGVRHQGLEDLEHLDGS